MRIMSGMRQRHPSSSNQEFHESQPLQEFKKLLHWNDLPHWLQDNAHIHSHYRSPSNSFSKSFASLSYLHNETVNIYTHLLPAALSVPTSYFLYRVLQPRYQSATSEDIVAFACFFLGFALCLGTSATYHTISNHSPRVNQLGNQLDYVGIVLLITGSFVPSVYYGFWCKRELQMGYWTMVNNIPSLPFSTRGSDDYRSARWEQSVRQSRFYHAFELLLGGPLEHACSSVWVRKSSLNSYSMLMHA